MDEELRKKVAEWILQGFTVSEIHQRLEAECGLRLTRLEVRMLVGDLERGSPQTVSAAQSSPNTGPIEQSRVIDYLEQRLRTSAFERCVGARIPVSFRWLFFIPAGLVTGVCVFGVTLVAWTLIAPMSGDEDVMAFGGMAAGLFGGFSSVLVGMLVAPRGARIVAGIMGGACLVLTAIVLFLVWSRLDAVNRVCSLIGGGIYSFCAVVIGIVFGRSEYAGQRQKRKT
jgi:hypothetical protein